MAYELIIMICSNNSYDFFFMITMVHELRNYSVNNSE